jgi:hypothetical protein
MSPSPVGTATSRGKPRASALPGLPAEILPVLLKMKIDFIFIMTLVQP